MLELGLREALSLGDNYVVSEHLLLGLVGEGEGVGMQVLQAFDISPEAVRSETIRSAANISVKSKCSDPRRRRAVARWRQRLYMWLRPRNSLSPSRSSTRHPRSQRSSGH